MTFEEDFPGLKGKVLAKVLDEEANVFVDCYAAGWINIACLDKSKVKQAIERLTSKFVQTQDEAMCLIQLRERIIEELGLDK